MPKDTSYEALAPDLDGRYTYSDSDLQTWSQLFDRQMTHLEGKIAPEFFDGVHALGLSAAHVPQVKDIDERLAEISGAGVEGVPAIIPPTRFFTLLSQRRFPVATFLRRPEHIDYIEEPDLFHEVFGHCPMLTQPRFADFIETVGQLALDLDKSDRWYLFRLFWFTVEFGLIRTGDGLRAYGAGIASSPAEATHALSDQPEVRDFDLLEVLRTPYRIDIVQPVYFALTSFDQLADSIDNIRETLEQAKALGDLPPLFEPAKAS